MDINKVEETLKSITSSVENFTETLEKKVVPVGDKVTKNFLSLKNWGRLILFLFILGAVAELLVAIGMLPEDFSGRSASPLIESNK